VLAGSFYCLLFALHGETGWAAANLFVASAAAGFLLHNWPPAKVFMGDAGSSFLGAFFGAQILVAAGTTAVSPVVLLLPLSNFVLDTTATLFRRVRRGEKWYLPHRSHYYQRMTALGMSHRRVTVLELAASFLCCCAAAAYTGLGNGARAGIVTGIILAFVAAGWWIRVKEGTSACRSEC
jgi:UDP-N-acetylmuramyl pentapeptide phosphotransferase/UDP-N-acetylglucosamine-1-phosphate transferase